MDAEVVSWTFFVAVMIVVLVLIGLAAYPKGRGGKKDLEYTLRGEVNEWKQHESKSRDMPQPEDATQLV